jgi:hypothetical protein
MHPLSRISPYIIVMSVMDVTLGREPHREGLFSVTIGVTVDGASRQRTVTQKPHRCGKCDDCDGPDDEMQRFSKGLQQLICVTTPPIIVGLTNLSIYRPGRGEPVDGTLVDGRGAASALKVNTEDATPARIE